MSYKFLKNQISNDLDFPFNLLKDNFIDICNFYSSDTSLCCLNGEAASFKSDLLNYSLNCLNDNVLLFKFNCFESSTLDDIFLSFFDDLKKYSQQKKVSFSKLETNDFAQKINTYMSHINLPCLIVIDSFEAIINKINPIEKEQIYSYIKHLVLSNKFKIVLISQKKIGLFDDLDKIEIAIPRFSEEMIKKYFDFYSIQNDSSCIAQFYQITKGDTLQLLLTVNIIQTLKISLITILEEFKLKNVSFDSFLLQKIMTFVPDSVKKALNFLSLYNATITEDYLVREKFLTTEQIIYLLDKGILKKENACIFIKPYFAKFFSKMIAPSDKTKIYRFWLAFFESQLPLKPNDRVTLLSRNTMRSQIAFYNTLLPQQVNNEKQQADMSLMSYLNSNLTAWNIKNTNIKPKDNAIDNSAKEQQSVSDSSLKKYELTKEELSLLNNPVDLRKKNEEQLKENLYRTIEQREENFLKQKNKTLDDIFNSVIKAREDHDFDVEFTLLCSMLNYKNDVKFYEYEPIVLNSLALCSINLNKTVDAIDFYNKLVELYISRSDEISEQETKLKIATIYKDSYKFNHARVIYEKFISKKSKVDDKILFQSYVELADIEEKLSNIDKAIELYKNAFALYSDSINIDKNYLANAYYKYALILDDYNQVQAALNYYQKSISLAEPETPFLASVLVNFAEILKEQGNIVKSVESFQKALFIDEALNNYDGIYYISLKLSQIAEFSAPELVEDLLLKSLNAAIRTNEYGYVVNARIELGDYYLNKDLRDKALFEFLKAKNILDKNNHTNNDYRELELRINDLKNSIPIDFYNRIIKEVENDIG